MCQSLLRPEDLKICLHVWTGKFKDYYVTSLFLFLNISVVFSQEGSMVVFLGSLGWMLLLDLQGTDSVNLGNSCSDISLIPVHAQPFPFLTTLFILFCSLLFLPFSKHCTTRKTPGALLNEDLCEWESRKCFDGLRKKLQNVTLKLLERQMWCTEML